MNTLLLSLFGLIFFKPFDCRLGVTDRDQHVFIQGERRQFTGDSSAAAFRAFNAAIFVIRAAVLEPDDKLAFFDGSQNGLANDSAI